MARKAIFTLLLLAGLPAWPGERLIYHDVKLDSFGGIVPWYGTGPSEAYDHVIRLTWNFWRTMRNCPNGVPYYMQHQVWKFNHDDRRGLGGDQVSMGLSAWDLLYGYLGDEAVKENMVFMADYWLAHGLSRPGDLWGNLPYPYNTDLHSGEYDGDMEAGKGVLQPDKAASFGAELVMLYKMTGNDKYLNAAVAIADTLAARVKPGDGENSPWPYRVYASSGEVHSVTERGVKHTASYTSNWTGALRLFDGLNTLGKGNKEAYTRARDIAAAWLKAYPLKTNKWGPFFEDVSTQNYSDTEINADTLAWYILEHREWSSAWQREAAGIRDWSFRTFANRQFLRFGVIPINEQTVYRVPGNSHSSRHASVELLYCEKTGNLSRKSAAVRRLNWATYMVDDDGKNRYPRNDVWLTDGYGDYIRHYLRAMASFPELAPEDQNHLLRTSSVIRSIAYGAGRITYTKFDAASTEKFKLGAWAPASVTGGAMQWDAKTKVLTVKASAEEVIILRTK